MTTRLEVRPAAAADIRRFASWRHEPPYDVYDITQPVDEAISYFLSIGTHVIDYDGELAAFFTFGSDARVPGGDYSTPALDIGLGLKPSLTGKGLGGSFVRALVDYVSSTTPGPLRVTIAGGNQRAQRVWLTAGFIETQRFTSPEAVLGTNEFVVLEKPSA